jgi:hypothetical protein
MQFDDALFGEAGVARYVAKVGAALAAITDRNLQVPRFRCRFVLVIRDALQQQGFHVGVGTQARVKIDEHGGICRVQIEDSAHSLEGAREAGHGQVDVERDFVAERE